jgi:hypothetical protein
MPEYDSRADTLAHIHRVRDHLDAVIAVLLHRGRVHDASKFSPQEKPALDGILPRLAGVAYGSPEFEALAEEAKPALAHHYAHNSHHPEHHADGIAGMDLFDLVEMLCDWKAAAERNPGDGVKLDYNIRQFAIAPQLAAILANTLARWPGDG